MQRTLTAARIACAAILLAGANNQSVEFIIQWRVPKQAMFEDRADFFVTLLAGGQVMPFEHAPGISVDDEHRMLRGIQQNGIRGFRSDAMHREKFLAQDNRWGAKHFRERATILLAQEANEAFQFLGLLAKISGRANKPRQLRE